MSPLVYINNVGQGKNGEETDTNLVEMTAHWVTKNN